MKSVSSIVEDINNYLWGIPTTGLLFGAYLFLTFRAGFIQRRIFVDIRLSIIRDSDSHGDINQLVALTTALASTIGTGDIIGMGAAITLGEPGTVLWCWLTGVLGTATKYDEFLTAVKYRVYTEGGTMLGGAMYVLERGLSMRWLDITFAILGILTSFDIGCDIQANATSSIVNSNVALVIMTGFEGLKSFLDTYPWFISFAVGFVMGGITCLVTFGGTEFIARVCEEPVPSMAFLYVMDCLMILFINHASLGRILSVIFKSVLTEVRSIAGGPVGTDIMMSTRYRIARELFSNESGAGSAPIVAAAAQTHNSVRQALVSAIGTFWDTVVVCLMTGLVLVSSIIGHDTINVTSLSGDELTNASFSLIPYTGQPILIVGIITFVYFTVLGRFYHGRRYLEYLTGKRGAIPYRAAWIAVPVAAPAMQPELAWPIADTLNALTTIPNLIAVLLLSDAIAKETKYYPADLDERDNALTPLTGDRGVLPLLKK